MFREIGNLVDLEYKCKTVGIKVWWGPQQLKRQIRNFKLLGEQRLWVEQHKFRDTYTISYSLWAEKLRKEIIYPVQGFKVYIKYKNNIVDNITAQAVGVNLPESLIL